MWAILLEIFIPTTLSLFKILRRDQHLQKLMPLKTDASYGFVRSRWLSFVDLS